jgi:outer membrane protein assembly factor BamB
MKTLVALALTFSLAPVDPRPSLAPADPIEGRWIGEIGFPTDRTTYGIEFKPNASGKLAAFLYHPAIHFYGLEIPGEVKVDGANVAVEGAGLALSLVDGKLDGTYSHLRIPVTLHRTESFPAETPIPDLPAGPAPRWTTSLAAPIWSTPALRDGFAYVGTGGGVLHAVDLATGKIAWTFPAGRAIHGEPLATDDAVYFVCDVGYLFKLDRKIGAEVWRYDLDDARVPRNLPHPSVDGFDHAAPRPVLADGILYVGSGDGGLHAVDAASGKRVWRFATQGKIRTDAFVAGPTVYATSLDHSVYAVERATGKQLWSKDTRAEITSSPVLFADKLLVGTRGSVLYGLDPSNGDVGWRGLFWGSWVESTPVPWKDLVYIGSSDERAVSCYDPKDGRLVWRTDVFGWSWGRPVVTEKHVYASVGGIAPYPVRHVGGLCMLDRETGKMLWRRPTEARSGSYENGFAAGPALAKDTLVVGDLDGNLFAFSVES